MEADAELDQRADARPAADGQPAVGRPMDARNQPEKRALTGAVPPDDADGFAGVDGERHVAQRPEFFDLLAAGRVQDTEEALLERPRTVVPQEELLGHTVGFDHPGHQTCSARRSSQLTKNDAPSTNMPIA